MAYEIMVGLQVMDRDRYQTYRNGIARILNQYGGECCYDMLTNWAIKPSKTNPINHTFRIRFASQADKTAFFDDPAYLKIHADFYRLQ